MKRRFQILLAAFFLFQGIGSSLRADEATDQTLTSIEEAVKANKASPKEIRQWISLLGNDTTPIPVKERAAWGLGFVGKSDVNTVPALLKAAEHKGLLVRSAAVNSLIRLKAKSALKVLTSVAQTDPILALRRDATHGLGLLESDKAIPTLVTLAGDPTPEVRGAAALAMSALQSKKNDFTDALKEMKGDENPYVQNRAANSLTLAQQKNTAARELLSSDDQGVRLFTALYFLRHGGAADKKAVDAAYDGESDDDVRKILGEAKAAIKKRSTPKKTAGTAKKKSTSSPKKPAKAATKP